MNTTVTRDINITVRYCSITELVPLLDEDYNTS